MSSPCLSGSRPYLLDLELVKSATTSQTSSPSSTLSESSNSPLAISTRKSRTPRKRPNQTYNEAATILSTVCPSVFSIKHFPNRSKFYNLYGISDGPLLCDTSESLLPLRAFDDSVFLINHPVKDSSAGFFSEHRMKYSCRSSCSTTTTSANNWEVDSKEVGGGRMDSDSDFDAQSILDEEIEEGIDSILGNPNVQFVEESRRIASPSFWDYASWCPGPIGLSLGGRNQFGMKTAVMRALRRRNSGSSHNSPVVDVLEIFPKCSKSSGENLNSVKLNPSVSSKKKPKSAKNNSGDKKKNTVEKPATESKQQEAESPKNPPPVTASTGLRLKLNYDEVLIAWSDRSSPFPEETAGGNLDVSARLAQIDLFFENGGIREASVLRYKEKRRTRLFSKKIRYQVRKVNADRRPRMKGRFVRRPIGENTGLHVKEEKPITCS